MKATHLTLVSHAATQAQRLGRLPAPDDAPLAGELPALAVPATGHCRAAPEIRTQGTAQRLGWVCETDAMLRDCDLGTWQGLALADLERQAPTELRAWLQNPHATPHGGESVAALCQRVAAWLDSVPDAGHWYAVTHPFVIRAAVLHALQAPLTSFYHLDVPPLAQVRLSRLTTWKLRL